MEQITGHMDALTRTGVWGWIASRSAPSGALPVSIFVNGTLVGRTIADEFREDLVGVFAGATGRYGFHFSFAPPLSVLEAHDVAVAVNNNLLPSRKWSRMLPSLAQDTLPILVTSAGRSGSTLLMNRLNSHPEIVLVDEHPAEVKLLTYYALALRVLTSPEDREHSTNPNTMLADLFTIGFNPFNTPDDDPLMSSYWNRTVPLSLARAFRELILDFYEAVRINAGKLELRYFAEKAQPDPVIRRAAAFMFREVREIVLLRDPLDLVCSYHAFWKLELTLARKTVASELAPLLALWAEKPANTLFLKYEELALRPEDTMQRVFEFLSLDPAPASAAAVEDAEVFKIHGTSLSPAASIGRWREGLPAAEVAACEQDFADFLSEFDYDRRGP